MRPGASNSTGGASSLLIRSIYGLTFSLFSKSGNCRIDGVSVGRDPMRGSIARLESQYVLGLRATNCRSGEILDDEQVRAPKKEDVLNALSGVARNFRTNAGESLATVKQRAAPIRRCHYTIALSVETV